MKQHCDSEKIHYKYELIIRFMSKNNMKLKVTHTNPNHMVR